MVFDTKHAISFEDEAGAEILMHVGLDTVNLKGEHFEALVKEGDKVKAGTPVLKVDLEAVKAAGYDVVTPILITNSLDFGNVISVNQGEVKVGDPIVKAAR